MTRLPALALIALPLLAGPVAAANSIELCTQLSQTAYSAMELRQTNAPLHEIMPQLSAALSGDELALAMGLIELAYSQPAFGTAEYQEQASADFANAAFRACRED